MTHILGYSADGLSSAKIPRCRVTPRQAVEILCLNHLDDSKAKLSALNGSGSNDVLRKVYPCLMKYNSEHDSHV